MTLPVRRAVAVLTLAGALVTAGCGSLETDRAATVDGTVISETEVQAVMTQFNGMDPQLLQQPFTPSSALTALVRAQPALDFFEESGVVASDTVAESEAQARGVQDPSEGTLQVIRFIDALNQAATSQQFTPDDEAELLRRIGEQDITVNPRYGTFDAQNAAVGPSLPDWVSEYDPEQ